MRTLDLGARRFDWELEVSSAMVAAALGQQLLIHWSAIEVGWYFKVKDCAGGRFKRGLSYRINKCI